MYKTSHHPKYKSQLCHYRKDTHIYSTIIDSVYHSVGYAPERKLNQNGRRNITRGFLRSRRRIKNKKERFKITFFNSFTRIWTTRKTQQIFEADSIGLGRLKFCDHIAFIQQSHIDHRRLGIKNDIISPPPHQISCTRKACPKSSDTVTLCYRLEVFVYHQVHCDIAHGYGNKANVGQSIDQPTRMHTKTAIMSDLNVKS